MAEVTVPGGGSGKSNVSRIVIIVGGLVLVALVGVIVALVMVLNRGEQVVYVERDETPEQRSVLITEDNIDEVFEQAAEEPLGPIPQYYNAVMSTTWNFPDGSTSPSPDAYVENSTENETAIYFDVLLRETEETIYQSPVIPLGERMNVIALDKELEPGSYACILVYHLINDRQQTLTTVNMGITVNVSG